MGDFISLFGYLFLSGSLLRRNPQRFHLPVKVAALQAQHLHRGARNIAFGFVQLFQNA